MRSKSVTKQSKRSDDERKRAEAQIEREAKRVDFFVTEYNVEYLADMVRKEEYFVPEYQREFTWPRKTKGRFIESVLIGLPIPFVFFYQAEDGRFEIVDGSQRLRTLREFIDGELALDGVDLLDRAKGFRFADLTSARQRRFKQRSMRGIVLGEGVDLATRAEMFDRVNTSGTSLNEAEIRRGASLGPFRDLVVDLATDERFVSLTPMGSAQVEKREREELVTRFFVYWRFYGDRVEPFPGYQDRPKTFLFEGFERLNAMCRDDPNLLNELREAFHETMQFLDGSLPHGLSKEENKSRPPVLGSKRWPSEPALRSTNVRNS